MKPDDNRTRLEEQTSAYFASLTAEALEEENQLAAALSTAAVELDCDEELPAQLS